MPALSLRRWLVIALVASAGRLAAQDQSDDRWLRHCQRDHGDDGQQRYCEVRRTGFHLRGASLTIEPDANGGVSVEGWDRDSVGVTLRIQTGARTEADARGLAQDVSVEAAGSGIRVHGPGGGHHRSWSVSLVVQVPRRTGLAIETTNGPLAVHGVQGTMDLRATNGPVELDRVGGDVRARVQNGPLSVELAGTSWEGKGLDAESVNGPVELALPEGYNAELETGTVNGPMTTSVPLTITLQGRMRDRIRTTLGKGGPPVRVVTTNGPITIRRGRG